MNLSKEDIEYLLTLKKVCVDTTNSGASNLYKYISSPYTIGSNFIIQGQDSSFIQLTNLGNSTLCVNNEPIKSSHSLDNVLLLRINKDITEKNYNIDLSFDDILHYKKINLEINFTNFRDSTLTVKLPEFIKSNQLSEKAIDFIRTYRQKYQINIIPLNYIFSHINIKTNSTTRVVIQRFDGETNNALQNENIYLVYNDLVNSIFNKTKFVHEPIMYEKPPIISIADKYIVYENIPLNESTISSSSGLFYSRDDCLISAYKFNNIPNGVLDKVKKNYGFVIGDSTNLIQNLNILYSDKTNLKGTIYPKYLFQLFNGSYCAVYDSMDYRNKALELIEPLTYYGNTLPSRDSLVTIKIIGVGTKNFNINFNTLVNISKDLQFINLSMNSTYIWITIRKDDINSVTQLLETKNIQYTVGDVQINTSYMTKYKKLQLSNLLNTVSDYILIGNNRELIVSSRKYVKPSQLEMLTGDNLGGLDFGNLDVTNINTHHKIEKLIQLHKQQLLLQLQREKLMAMNQVHLDNDEDEFDAEEEEEEVPPTPKVNEKIIKVQSVAGVQNQLQKINKPIKNIQNNNRPPAL